MNLKLKKPTLFPPNKSDLVLTNCRKRGPERLPWRPRSLWPASFWKDLLLLETLWEIFLKALLTISVQALHWITDQTIVQIFLRRFCRAQTSNLCNAVLTLVTAQSVLARGEAVIPSSLVTDVSKGCRGIHVSAPLPPHRWNLRLLHGS